MYICYLSQLFFESQIYSFYHITLASKQRKKNISSLNCALSFTLHGNCQHFFKKLRALRVNETELSSRNNFIDNIFALENEKELKNDERTLFWYSPQSFDLLLTLSLRATPIGVFPDYFGFSKFLATSCCFCKKN